MNMKPNKDNLRKWIKALRSGRYQQIRGTLKVSYPEGYCCLGVGCEVYRKETQQGFWNGVDAFVLPFAVPESNIMPHEVAYYFGTDKNPDIRGHHLSEWNDKENATFEEIADLIEKEYEL